MAVGCAIVGGSVIGRLVANNRPIEDKEKHPSRIEKLGLEMKG